VIILEDEDSDVDFEKLLPCSSKQLLSKFKNCLFEFEKKEIEGIDKIYFMGQATHRTSEEMEIIRENESEVTGELDDKEGYYNVLLGDHL
jgi:hypothetical protein